eukprot:GEMP01050640.1.p1 GENE.GEMP01050640.1~~GEMP01050640.1.p1  ORF type:complete len:272 (+),score=34.10 GEMP01050640.1:84-899(+)
MTCVDRTQDFARFLNRFSNGNAVAATSSSFSPQMSQFNALAGQIGAQIHATSQKVQELGRLSRAKGIFIDKTAQISTLQNSTKSDIDDLSKRIADLQSMALHSGSDHLQKHCQTLIGAVKTRVLALTNDFKNVLELRTKTMEEQNNRMQKYLPPVAKIGNYTADPTDPENPGGMDGQAVQFTNSRTLAISKVQGMIGEMATMFQKMSAMVAEQQEQLERIDGNVDTTIHNVKKGQAHLLDYFRSMSSNRWLILKVFGILIGFIVFFIIFIA